ncbi:hypothetical protein HK100_004816 [Physocladia obscura]|uniref:Crinkler effector protein N-terminal domain-containing protein n=1 Tax=Physocladia obscura TaxID=109957 RepID=A0AAD5XJF3_9FUNG|nr:hypothetical protein HK100_004816 [Physocladia obscura]
MTKKTNCVLSNDASFTGFGVEFDESLTVGELKEAIRAAKSPELDHVSADKLTLIRITGKTHAGGLTLTQIRRSRAVLNFEAFGENAEKELDQYSEFRSVAGACLPIYGFVFKVRAVVYELICILNFCFSQVMNSTAKVSFFDVPESDDIIYHVLVLVSPI